MTRLNPLKLVLIDSSLADIYIIEETITELKINCDLHVIREMNKSYSILKAEFPLPQLIIISSAELFRHGKEEAVRIKKDELLKSIPMVILTDFEGEEKHLLNGEYEAVLYLRRPFSNDDFSSAVIKICKFLIRSKEKKIFKYNVN